MAARDGHPILNRPAQPGPFFTIGSGWGRPISLRLGEWAQAPYPPAAPWRGTWVESPQDPQTAGEVLEAAAMATALAALTLRGPVLPSWALVGWGSAVTLSQYRRQ